MSKVLVVDDSDFMKDVILEALDLIGMSGDKASNGVEALNLLKQNKDYSLVITDVNMPEMDGLTLIKEIRKLNEDLPILVLTTESEEKTKKEAIKNGANSWLVKPFEATKLLSIIKELIE